jgi:hypothetical protein
MDLVIRFSAFSVILPERMALSQERKATPQQTATTSSLRKRQIDRRLERVAITGKPEPERLLSLCLLIKRDNVVSSHRKL